MIARLNTASRVARWSVPSLDPRETEMARAPGGSPTRQPNRPAAGAKAKAADDGAAAAAALEAIRAQKAAEGHAEGVARGREEGRAQGYDEGYAAGRQAADAELAATSARIAKVAEALGGQIKVLDDAVEDAVVALALELARRIVGAEINRSREALVGLIRQVLTEIPIDTGTPRILLHPDDLTALRQHMAEIGAGNVELVADDGIEPGGCRVLADSIDGETRPDRRWVERSNLFESDLTLASRWRAAMLALFD
jgi:flagellar assembly protein FliH